MNILHIHRRFFPNIGGVEKYIYNLSGKLIEKKINTRVLTLNYDIFNKDKKDKDFDIIKGIEIYRIPGFGHYKKPIPLRIPIDCFGWADIVHIHDPRILFETSIILKKIYGYKLVFSTHGFIFHTDNFLRIKLFMARRYYRPIITKYFDGIICDSKQDYDYFSKWKLDNTILFENPINFKKFNSIGKNINTENLLYFGRVDWNKGLDMLFGSLSLLKNKKWHLDIAGPGSKDVIIKLKKLAESLNISNKIKWHGFIDDGKLFSMINKAHICLFPSTYEGFGFTLVEAMAAGCICIANSIKPYEDIIRNNYNGYIVDFTQTDKAAKVISKLLSKPVDRMVSLENNAVNRARDYDWSERIDEIIRLYKSV